MLVPLSASMACLKAHRCLWDSNEYMRARKGDSHKVRMSNKEQSQDLLTDCGLRSLLTVVGSGEIIVGCILGGISP